MAGGFAFGAGFFGGLNDTIDTEAKREHDLQKQKDSTVLQVLGNYATQFPVMYNNAVKDAQAKRAKYEATMAMSGGDPRIADAAMKGGIDVHTEDGRKFVARMKAEQADAAPADYKSDFLGNLQSQLDSTRMQGEAANAQLQTATAPRQRTGLLSRMMGQQTQQGQGMSMPSMPAVDVSTFTRGPNIAVEPDLDKDPVIGVLASATKDLRPGVFKQPQDRAKALGLLQEYTRLAKSPQVKGREERMQQITNEASNLINPRDTSESGHGQIRTEREALARSAGYKPGSFGWNYVIARGDLPKAAGVDTDNEGQMVKAAPGISNTDIDQARKSITVGIGAAKAFDATGAITALDSAQGPTIEALTNEAVKNYKAARQARIAEGKSFNDLNLNDFATGTRFKHLGTVYDRQAAEEYEAEKKKQPNLKPEEFRKSWLKKNPEKAKILEIITRE